jgi:predicted nucleotidyltransferase
MPTQITTPEAERILATLRPHLSELKAQYGVARLGIFGSYVRGEQHASSDLDVLVGFERTPTLFQLARLQRYLGSLIGIEVDLVLERDLKPGIGKNILAEVVYA